MFLKNLQQSADEAARKQQADNLMAGMKEILSSSFQNAGNYANAIIFAGYAGIFAIWTITKDGLDFLWSGVVGILLIISIGSFVSFEIYKMLKLVLVQLRFVNSVHRSAAPDNIIKSHGEYVEAEKSAHISMMGIWLLCFSVSVATGLASGAILLWSLIQAIISIK